MGLGRKHLVIGDTQVKPGVRTDHLEWIGKFAADKRPDVIVHLGDHWDMPSLSSYDRGRRSAENRRVAKDIDAGNAALSRLTEAGARASGARLVILRGNHEQRIERYVEDHPELDGAVGYHQFNDVSLGWKPIPFLAPITIDGLTYCHYFPRSGDGSISQTKRGAPSARAQVLREMRTCVAGHKQGLDTWIHQTGGRTIRGIIAGSCYLHQEAYLSPQGTNYWRGVLLLHQVRNGNFALCEVPLSYLKEKYGTSMGNNQSRSRKPKRTS